MHIRITPRISSYMLSVTKKKRLVQIDQGARKLQRTQPSKGTKSGLMNMGRKA